MTPSTPECSRCTSGHTVPVKFICTLCFDKERDQDRKTIADLQTQLRERDSLIAKQSIQIIQRDKELAALKQPELPL